MSAALPDAFDNVLDKENADHLPRNPGGCSVKCRWYTPLLQLFKGITECKQPVL